MEEITNSFPLENGTTGISQQACIDLNNYIMLHSSNIQGISGLTEF